MFNKGCALINGGDHAHLRTCDYLTRPGQVASAQALLALEVAPRSIE